MQEIKTIQCNNKCITRGRITQGYCHPLNFIYRRRSKYKNRNSKQLQSLLIKTGNKSAKIKQQDMIKYNLILLN